eukprot:2168617-Prymnesium_polylepis.1
MGKTRPDGAQLGPTGQNSARWAQLGPAGHNSARRGTTRPDGAQLDPMGSTCPTGRSQHGPMGKQEPDGHAGAC